jgi:hypothetical protein
VDRADRAGTEGLRAAATGRPGFSRRAVRLETPPPGVEPLGNLLKTVDRYLQGGAAHLQEESSRILPHHQASGDLVERIRELVRRTLQEEVILPARVGQALALGEQLVRKFRDRERAAPRASVEALLAQAKAEARAALDQHLTQTQQVIHTISQQEVCDVINQSLRRSRPALVEVVLREQRGKVLDRTVDYFAERQRGLRNLARAATQEDPSPGDHSSGGDKEGPFSTPLFSLTSPHDLAPAGSNGSVPGRDHALKEQFYQLLVAPVLASLTLHKDLAASIPAARQRLQAELAKLRGSMEEFLKTYQEDHTREFHQELDGQAPSEHRFFKPLSRIIEGATAKIAVNQSRRFAETLDVIVAQHREDSCVPKLLEARVGRSYREALVTAAYEERTRAWVQMMQLRYGFCLEALDVYGEYKAATARYLAQARFKPSDLWLDARWYKDYQELLNALRGNADGRRQARTPTSRAATLAQGTTDLREVYDAFLKDLSERVRSATFAQPDDRAQALERLLDYQQRIAVTLRQPNADSREDLGEIADQLLRYTEDVVRLRLSPLCGGEGLAGVLGELHQAHEHWRQNVPA